jgi:hypothetical protein
VVENGARPEGHWPKIIRAEEHLAAVRAEIDFWREGDVCRAIGKFESDTEYVIRIEDRIPPPIRLAILIGDVVTSLQSALDHIAFALVSKYDPERAADPERRRWIYYPVYETEVDKKGKPVSFGALNGIPETVLTVIQTEQPYAMGPDAPRHPLATIQRLANTDKHRTLLLASAFFTKGGSFGVTCGDIPLRSTFVHGVFKPVGAENSSGPVTCGFARAAAMP